MTTNKLTDIAIGDIVIGFSAYNNPLYEGEVMSRNGSWSNGHTIKIRKVFKHGMNSYWRDGNVHVCQKERRPYEFGSNYGYGYLLKLLNWRERLE